jgi:hypothetical protein
MLHRLNHIILSDPKTSDVATGTVFRRPLENSVDVARLTSRCHVLSCQRETGLQVIEISPNYLSVGQTTSSHPEHGGNPSHKPRRPRKDFKNHG